MAGEAPRFFIPGEFSDSSGIVRVHASLLQPTGSEAAIAREIIGRGPVVAITSPPSFFDRLHAYATHQLLYEFMNGGWKRRCNTRTAPWRQGIVRQQISNTATAMFLVHGFDNVTVARIAAACEVSEQTVFNYFPTKESMFFDRSESMITAVADAVRERGSTSLVEAVLQPMGGGIRPGPSTPSDEASQLRLSRLFCEAATESPTLVAARFADLPRFIDEVSVALAQRIGVDPIDPEVQLATLVIAGLVRVRMESTFHHVQHATSIAALNKAVQRDVLRAARLAEPTLSAFDNMPKRRRGRGAAPQRKERPDGSRFSPHHH